MFKEKVERLKNNAWIAWFTINHMVQSQTIDPEIVDQVFENIFKNIDNIKNT